MSKTEDNLKEAFAGESQANRKYLAFAKKAKEDGFAQVAKLFRAAAAAETIHAHAHLAALGGIKTTKENLMDAIEGETHEFTTMYPEMIEDAKSESENEALGSFSKANKVEEVHAALYKEALSAVDSGKDLEESDIYVCDVCGNTVGVVPDRCPVCGVGKEKFTKIE